MRTVLKAVLALGLLLACAAGLHLATAGVDVPAGPESRVLLRPGPFDIGVLEVDFVDESRVTRPNREFPGQAERRLESTVWYPAGADGDVARRGRPRPGFPLIVYSHGFRSARSEGRYLARHFASHGYVFVAADFPLTGHSSPGGPRLDDVAHQPGDVRHLIDRLLGWSADPDHDFSGAVDGSRVGAMGLSLGGMTSTLVGFHSDLRDPRVAAVVSIAGPSVMFTPAFFETADLPFLMIAGDEDAVVDYEANAASLPARAPGAGLVTLRAGSHIGFAEIARYLFRWAANVDNFACRRLLAVLADRSPEGAFAGLGGLDQGVDQSRTSEICDPLPTARTMRPARQQMLTTLAAFGFFQSRFAGDPAVRRRAGRYLATTLAEENGDASVRLPSLHARTVG